MRASHLRHGRVVSFILIALTAACGMRERGVVVPVSTDSTAAVHLVASPVDSRAARLDWTVDGTPVPSSGVLVFRDDKAVATSTSIGWHDDGLAPRTPYRYQVALVRTDGKSPIYSNVVHLVTPHAAALRVEITPASSDASVGVPVQLVATVRDSATGVVETGHTVSWSSSDGSMATVSPSGLLTPHRPGQVVVTAAIPTAQAQKPMAIIAPEPPRAASVTVSPAESVIDIGQTITLTAVARDSLGQVLTRTFAWSSSSASVASVQSGVVTGVAQGVVTISAQVDGMTGVAQVTVRPASGGPVDVATVTIEPATTTLAPGGTAQLTAIVRDGQGRVLTGRTVTWGTENAGVASVNTTGRVTAHGVGTTVIVASSGGATGTALVHVATPPPPPPAPVASISVTPPTAVGDVGATVQFSATVRDASGTILTGRTVTWTSSSAGVATVQTDGRATAKAAGSTTITATSEGKTATATFTVQVNAPPPPAVASVTVTPPTPTVAIGSDQVLTAQVRDISGTLLVGRVVTWTSSAPSVATVSPTGVVAGIAAGTAVITARSEGVSGTATVTVPAPPPPAPVHTVSVTPSSANLPIGTSLQLNATTQDAQGATLTGRVVTWSSANTAVATVSSSGLVTAVGPGTVVITATSEGKTGQATITVDPPPVTTVTVTPAPVSLEVGLTTPLTAVTKGAGGTVLPGRVVTWLSSNPSVVTVSASGVLTGVAVGSAQVTATSEGVSTVVSVTVVAPPVTSVTVTPAPVSVEVGLTAPLTAVTKGAGGTVLPGRVVTWLSSNPSVVTVSVSGVLTGVAVGSAQVTATSEGISTVVTVTVVPRAVASVTINAVSLFCVGATLQLVATVKDSDGNVLTGRVVVWTTNTGLVASVSPSGLLVGLSLGTVTVTATVEGVSATLSLSLCPPVVATVSITPPPSILSLLGLPLQLIAVAKDANGNVIVGRPITWSVTPANRALISIGGLLTPLLLGGITVTATIDGVAASVVLTIGL